VKSTPHSPGKNLNCDNHAGGEEGKRKKEKGKRKKEEEKRKKE
jgi:hypothetical protein